MRITTFFMALASLLALTVAAQAFEVPAPSGTAQALYQCYDHTTWSAKSADAPPEIAAAFAGQGARLAFRTCRDRDRNLHYFLREPRPNRNNVCRSFEKEIFRGSASDAAFVRLDYDTAPNWYFMLHGWTGLPPADWQRLGYAARSQDFGFLSDETCPPVDDARYAPLTNMTDGMLKSFHQVWSRITASPEALRTAFANLPVDMGPLPARLKTPERVQEFRERLIANILAGRQRATSYDCDSGGCSTTFDGFTLTFDVGSNGIVFTGLIALLRV